MRILDKYLYKELGLTFVAVLAVLLLIMFGTETTRLLAMAVEGKLPPSIVFHVLLLKIPPALELILPLVALLSVMLAMGRLYQDQEIVVLNSCGVGESYFQRRVAWFLLPMMVLTLFVTLWLSPWALQKERELVDQAQVTAPLAGLVAGRFNSLPQSEGVLYAKEIRANGRLQEVWIRMQQAERDVVMLAPSGHFEWINGRLALVLLNGHSYEGLLVGQTLSVRQFERFEGFLPELASVSSSPSVSAMSTVALWQSDQPALQIALQWRLVVPLSVLVLGLLALKLSKTGPREGRFAKVFIAIVLYVFYMQTLITLSDRVKLEQWPLWLGLWWVPLLFLAFALKTGAWFKLKSVVKLQGAG